MADQRDGRHRRRGNDRDLYADRKRRRPDAFGAGDLCGLSQGNESTSATAGAVAGVADIPIISATASAGTTTENTAILLSGLTLQPGDSSTSDAADSFTATLYVADGTLAVANGTGSDTFKASSVTVGGGNGDGSAASLTITGTLANVQAALDHVQYTPTGEFEGTDTVHFTALSTEEAAVGGNASADATAVTAAITVNGTADTPTVSTPNNQTTTENVAVGLTGLSVSEAAGDSGDTINVTLSVNDGSLAVGGSHTGLTGTFSGSSITFSGSLSNVTTALADNNISYTPTSEFEGQDTLTFSATTTEEADVGGGTSSAASHTATITVNPPPVTLGFTFTPDAATSLALEGNNNDLANNTQIGTFTETGGNAGDSYTFTIGGAGLSKFSPTAGTNLENFFTANNGAGGLTGSSGGTVYALTVQVDDTTNSTNSGPLPFDVVVGSSGNNTINLETGAGNLGIAPTTPTIVYGLGGNDTIVATGMTAPVWFVGGAGSDTMTGGSGVNAYLFAAVSEFGNAERGLGPRYDHEF